MGARRPGAASMTRPAGALRDAAADERTVVATAHRAVPLTPAPEEAVVKHKAAPKPIDRAGELIEPGRALALVDFSPPSLGAGERLMVVTDGLTEAHDHAGDLYGEERVGAFLAALGEEAAPLPRLAAAVRAFEAGLPAFDDMAALLLTLDAPAAE